jgi:hypothetical protein
MRKHILCFSPSCTNKGNSRQNSSRTGRDFTRVSRVGLVFQYKERTTATINYTQRTNHCKTTIGIALSEGGIEI